MERAIGEVFEFEEINYRTDIEKTSCNGCSFKMNKTDCQIIEHIVGECRGRLREDKTGVIFIKIVD